MAQPGPKQKSVTANLRSAEGRAVLKRLMLDADVVIENFKPGTMEKWGLGPEDLKSLNPKLIYTRISGYGQTGPYSRKPGYASVTEAFSGFRYLNGFPDEVPVRPNLSLGDSVAGVHAALGILLALLARQNTQQGQTIDVALYEAMFNLMEGVVPEYDGAGAIREPAGSTLTGIVPTNTYLCRDGKHVVIGGNGDSIYKRLMTAIKREDLANDPALASNPGRVLQQQLIDAAIGGWTNAHTSTKSSKHWSRLMYRLDLSIPLKTPLMMRTTRREACLKKWIRLMASLKFRRSCPNCRRRRAEHIGPVVMWAPIPMKFWRLRVTARRKLTRCKKTARSNLQVYYLVTSCLQTRQQSVGVNNVAHGQVGKGMRIVA